MLFGLFYPADVVFQFGLQTSSLCIIETLALDGHSYWFKGCVGGFIMNL